MIDPPKREFGKRTRFFGDSKQEVMEKYEQARRRAILGVDHIEFTEQDKIAKRELGDRGTLLEAVRCFLGTKPATAQQTLGVACVECVAQKIKLNCRPAYTDHLEIVLKHFTTLIGADKRCSDITTDHVQRFLDSKNWAGSTLVGMRNRVSAFFAFALNKGYVTSNPVDKIKAPKVEKSVPTILSPAQAHKLLRTALDHDRAMVPYFVLGLFCGIRPDELAWLPTANVRLDEHIVDIPASVSKTRDRRLVDLAPNAVAWLRAAGEFDHTDDGRFITYRSRRRALIELANETQDGVIVEWSSDVMRHSFASYHIELHQSADKTALQLGHQGSTKMLFRHYKATVTKKEAAEFWELRPPMPTLMVLAKEAA